jgi:adenosylmethionine-8-amino-7-oxononanoate aminotransferase
MSTTDTAAAIDERALQRKARDHLWMHFARQSVMTEGDGIPIIVRGEGHHIWDAAGKRYFDGLSGLFVVNAGHGRRRLAEAAARQAEELAFFPIWSYAHPSAIELAERLASYAPGDLDRVFFSTGGGEAVETAFKLAKQYWKLMGRPLKHKVISRAIAYHGTPQGALAITGLPGMKEMFEPVTPGGFRVPNTNFYRSAEMGFVSTGSETQDLERFSRWAADRIEEMILFEGPETVAAVFLEPVQNSGGCFPPPPGYFQRVREICDRHDVLLVSDEVICAFGRIGEWFACDAYGYIPDMITCAKAMTSGYSPSARRS